MPHAVLLLLLQLALLLAGAPASAAALDPVAGSTTINTAGSTAGSTPAQPLLLRTGSPPHDGWDAAQMLVDADGSLTEQQVLARLGQFMPPGRLRGNLGKRSGAVWLHLPLRTAADAPVRWALNIDYASLDRIDVWLLDGQRPLQHALMGDTVPLGQRPMHSRGHVLMLDLPPGQDRQLLLRVQTIGSMLVPIVLSTPEQYQLADAREQALQGLLAGTGLCLLLYSLAQWLALRDPMFGLYAVTLLGSTAFFAALSGVGAQHVWGASPWLTENAAPFFILIGVCGAFLFVLRALEVDQVSPRVAKIVRALGGVAGLTAAGFAAGLISYQTAQGVGMALGPAPLLLVLPTAFKRLRAGDRAAMYVLAGWGFYSGGVVVIVSLLRGWLPLGFWTLHGFQLGSLVEMAMWLLVLGDRVHQIRRSAEQAHEAHARMRSLAHTDALTGLLNRRGLQDAMPALLARATPHNAVALYLIDLDGFKPVNDRLGHDAGDELLAGVACRLRDAMRPEDLVCRLGGDEFVLVAAGLARPADAERIGQAVLAAFQAPLTVAGEPCRIGLTIGYAMAPHDESNTALLLKRADAAMYAGKRGGKGQLQRGGASSSLALS